MRKLSTCLPVGRAETSKRSSTQAEVIKITSFSMSAIITHKIYEHPHSKGLESRLSRAIKTFSEICILRKAGCIYIRFKSHIGKPGFRQNRCDESRLLNIIWGLLIFPILKKLHHFYKSPGIQNGECIL